MHKPLSAISLATGLLLSGLTFASSAQAQALDAAGLQAIDAAGKDIDLGRLRRVTGLFLLAAANGVIAHWLDGVGDLVINGGSTLQLPRLRRICGGGLYLSPSSALVALRLPSFEGGPLTRLYVDFRDDVECEFELAQPPSVVGQDRKSVV